MVFNTVEFVVFFALVLLVYSRLQHRAQNRLLLLASYVFYGWWDVRFLALIAGSTVVDYIIGRRLEAEPRPSHRKALVSASLVANLGVLGVFKYFDFFVSSVAGPLAALGMDADSVTLKLVLPVGISFYTFQTLSYTIDVYRRKLQATRSFLDFALFVSFFPQLVAGPIERASHLLPQVISPRSTTAKYVREGLWLLLLGYFKKTVIADNMSPITSRLFEDPHGVHGLEVLIGVYAFAAQIYGDFSGYSDIARGTARLLGFDLMHNFRMPYLATNPSEFWQRWHISLSSWLRDYLYIPLGGNRLGELKTYRNLMLTMLLGGLWHGAAWNFVAWGLYQGVLLCGHRLWAKGSSTVTEGLTVRRVIKAAFFFQFVCFGWLLFGVKELADVPVLLRALVSPFEVNGVAYLGNLLLFVSPLFALDLLQLARNRMDALSGASRPLRLAVYATLFFFIVVSGRPSGAEFIYFQF